MTTVFSAIKTVWRATGEAKNSFRLMDYVCNSSSFLETLKNNPWCVIFLTFNQQKMCQALMCFKIAQYNGAYSSSNIIPDLEAILIS
jgi:hypothetical protein